MLIPYGISAIRISTHLIPELKKGIKSYLKEVGTNRGGAEYKTVSPSRGYFPEEGVSFVTKNHRIWTEKHDQELHDSVMLELIKSKSKP